MKEIVYIRFELIVVIFECLFYVKTDGFIYYNPIVLDKFDGIFVSIIKNE
jgi:hypothetical protein